MHLNKANLDIAKLAEKHPSYRGCLLITGTETVVTDARKMIIVELPDDGKAKQLDHWYIITKDDALALTKGLDSGLSKNATITFPPEGGLDVYVANSQVEKHVKTRDIRYPNYKDVVPKPERKPKVRVIYNPKYLAEIFSIFAKYCKDYFGVELVIYGDGVLMAKAKTKAGQNITALLASMCEEV